MEFTDPSFQVFEILQFFTEGVPASPQHGAVGAKKRIEVEPAKVD